VAICALAALLGALAPAPARAEGGADEADLHFQLGGAAYQRGDFTGALEHFFLSNRLVPNRNVVFNIAHTFEQLKRFADAHRHYVDALAGETNPRAIHDVEEAIARVAPNVAVLDVTTSPPGATIYLDRKDLGSRGRSPRPLALPPGRYRVLAELDGHEPTSSEIVVAELGKTARVTLTLPRIAGTVRVGGEGAGARGAAVRVDDEHGQPACFAPCELTLSPGPHQLFFSGEGYQGATQPLVVTARRTTPVTVALSPLTGSLVVSTEERGALVTIDGRAVGFTPVVIPSVPVGVQKIRVTLRDHAPIEREVLVKPGQEATLADLRLEPLREVTAVSRFAEQLDDAPSSVSVIDGRELRAFGYPTIAESLRGVRGFYLSTDHVYYSAGIRGIGQPNDYGNRLLVLSDGQSLNDNLLNSSYIGSDARVNLHDVERIEIVRGPGSLLYGTGAFSGVVNLVTRPRDEPNQVHLDVGTYDNAVLHASAGFHYNLGRDRGVWASASVARSDGNDLPVTLTAPPVGGAALQVAHGADKFTSGGTAGRAWWGPLTVQWLYTKRDQSTPIGSYGTVLDDPRSSSTDTRMMLEARYEPQLSSSFQLMTRVHANRYLFNGVYIFDQSTHIENFAGSWLGGEARLVYSPSARLRITGGGEGQYHPEATLLGTSVAAGGVNPYLDVHAPYHFGAGYALIEGTPAPWLRLSGGARVDVYSTFGPIVVPRAAVIVHPTKGGTLKLMGGRAFRAPSIYEQNYFDGNETQSKAKALLPESVYSGELEYAQRFLNDWVALAAAHGSYVEHLINTLPDPAHKGLASYQNSAVPALALGGDVELRREWRQGFMLTAMYGYQYARFLDPKNGNPRLASAPEHLASLRGVAPLVPELASLGLRATLEAPRRIDTQRSDVTAPAVILDATLSGGVSRLGLRYTVGVYNLAGWRYQLPVTETFLSRTLPQGGRTFLLDVTGTYPPS
jgi:outer membrane receptor protein involved in Fe transport